MMMYFKLVNLLLLSGVTYANVYLLRSSLHNPQFDQDVTPDVIFGSGNDNGSFTTHTNNNIELGLRGKLRFDETTTPVPCRPTNTFNSNGDGTYSFAAGGCSPSVLQEIWSFEFSINSHVGCDTFATQGACTTLDYYDYEIKLDDDRSSKVNFLVFDPVNPGTSPIVPDHSLGTDSTKQGVGGSPQCGHLSTPIEWDCPATPSKCNVASDATSGAGCLEGDTGTGTRMLAYSDAISSLTVAQNSYKYWIFQFYLGELLNFNYEESGIYTIELSAKDKTTGDVLAHVAIDILVDFVPPASKDDCKKKGWMNYDDVFENQGQCISFVNEHTPSTGSSSSGD